MKPGANFLDRNKIIKLGAEGYTAKEISGMLGIVETCVASFLPKEEPAPAPKPTKKKLPQE